MHEHVRFRDEAVSDQRPSRYDEQRALDAALVFDEVVPALRADGPIDDAAFETIFVQNSTRWLTV